MLTPEEEQKIRETVRHGLENILGEGGRGLPPGGPEEGAERERIVEAERIIAEETERYYARLGLVKHVSRSGQVFWVSAAEERRLRERRMRPRKPGFLAHLKPRDAVVWTVTILLAVLLVAYLVHTVSISGLIE